MSEAAAGDEGQLDAGHVPRPPHQHTLLHDQEQGPHPVLLPLQLGRPQQDGQQLQHQCDRPGERAHQAHPGREHSGNEDESKLKYEKRIKIN